MSRKRVVITGIGAITPMGSGVQALWDGILAGESKIHALTRFDSGDYQAWCAAEINDFKPEDHFRKHRLKRLDRYSEFAIVTARQAFEDAGFDLDPENPSTRVGISYGTALGGITTAEEHHARFVREGLKCIPPALALQVFGGSAHANIAIYFGIRGYSTTNSNSCASGTVSVGEAFRAIRDGYADAMLAGAGETPLAPLTFGAFDAIKAMAIVPRDTDPRTVCRPFDVKRSGFVMSEGACSLLLESLECAQERGARIYAEVLGYALNNDAYHMTSSLPSGESAIKAMQDSIDEAGLSAADIGYINGHASSTQMNDNHEALAIREVFGSHDPAVSGTKGVYGHPLGAAGAVEAAICALSLHHQTLPHTINCDEPIPEGNLDIITGEPRQVETRYCLSNSFGFGGINSTIVLGTAP